MFVILDVPRACAQSWSVCTCRLQDPTPVCTPTFLERRKLQVMEVSDDKDNEIIFKLPVPPVKEDSQKTPTPVSSGKKKRRKRKSEQWSWQRSLCIILGRCDLVIKAYCSSVGVATCKHRQNCWSKNTFCVSSEESHQKPGCFALSCPEFVFRFHSSLSLTILMKLRPNYHQKSLWLIGSVWTVCGCVYKPPQKKICQGSTSGIWNWKLNPESKRAVQVWIDLHLRPGAEEESKVPHS